MKQRLILLLLIHLCITPIFADAGLETSRENWTDWLIQQVQRQPDVVAAQKNMQGVFSQTAGMSLPLYNPDFAAELEQNGDDTNYRLGINQTVDIWDKRSTRDQQGEYLRLAAWNNYQFIVQQKTAETLRTLVQVQAARNLAMLAQDQENQMDRLLAQVEKYLQAGDMGRLDYELTFLGLSQRLARTAQAKARARETIARLEELLADKDKGRLTIPDSFWPADEDTFIDPNLDKLPEVAAAKAQLLAAQASAKLARLAGKAEPTVAINGGQDEGDVVVALNLSLPLNVRNPYQAEAKAAVFQAAAAKERYQAIKRRYRFALDSAQATLKEYQTAYRRWQNLNQRRTDSTGNLLYQLWKSGDMSTMDYLLALDRQTEGMRAGIELRTQYHLACIQWLLLSGQLDSGEKPQ